MAIKKENYYFRTFVDMVQYSCDAASLLLNIVSNYDEKQLKDQMKQMHSIEHSGDVKRREMFKRLSEEFISPIEREDIVALADAIDNVTDGIEDALERMYMFNITEMRDDAIDMAIIVKKNCEALKQVLEELHNFKRSQTINDLIMEVHRTKEEGAELFRESTRSLYLELEDPIEVLAWDRTLLHMIRCCEISERAADVVEGVIMKNS